MELEWYSQDAKEALLWTSKILEPVNKEFLKNLPLKIEIPEERFLCVHGSPRNPAKEYLVDSHLFLENLRFQTQPLCLIAHSHVPLYFRLNKKEEKLASGYLKPNAEIPYNLEEEIWTVNPGSIGQPRDGNTKASFLILDTAKKTFKNFRLDYPIRLAQEKMRIAGLPNLLAERLSFGK